MKKLLLLATLPLMLVGCGETPKESAYGSWKVVENEEYIIVTYGTEKQSFFGSDNAELKYLVNQRSNTAIEIFVKYTYNNKEENHYYCGSNVALYHYDL